MAQTFSWDHPELNEGAFIAFAALLRLRAGGVPTMQSSSDGSTLATNVIEGNEEEEDDDDDDDYDEDEDMAATIHTGRNDRLYNVAYKEKAEFLDSMAEVAANKKGKQAVAASAMWEREEDVIIWVAKNRGFQKVEERFFSQIADLLSGIASASKNDTEASNLKDQLWHAMLGHCRTRLNTYIENLVEHFSRLCPTDTQDRSGTFASGHGLPDALQKIKDLCTMYRTSETSDHCLERLVLEANEARKSIPRKDNAMQGPTRLRKVWTDIRFLSRLRIAYSHFIIIATGFACFEKVSIHCLNEKNILNSRILEPLSMAKTFGLLYDSEDAKVAASLAAAQTDIINRKREREAKRKRNETGKRKRKGSNRSREYTKETLERDFVTLQVESKFCHAEIQILLHLAVQGTTDDVYQYIGSSKYSCWLCWNFLEVFSQLRTRGCHDKMYHNWRIPEIGPLNTQSVDHIVNTLVQVQAKLKRSLLEENEQRVDAQAESSAGKTMFSDQASLPARPKNPSIARYREMLQEGDTEKSTSTKNVDLSRSASTSLSPCSICDKATSMRCKSCHAAYYCSHDCQERDWSLHKTVCNTFSCLSPRPAPSYKLAFLFPVETSNPELVYVDCPRERDEEDGLLFERPKVGTSSLLGNDNPLVGRLMINAHRGVLMDHTISIHFRDRFLKDGSKPNKSIIASTRGAVVHTWNGPFVVMRQPTTNVDPLVFVDVTLGDLRSVVDYFSAYRDHSVEDLEARRDMTEPILVGVKISCGTDRSISGAAEYSPAGARPGYTIFFAGDRPRMPELMEIPIRVLEIPPDQPPEVVEAWAADGGAFEVSHHNTPVTFLFRDADPQSTSWGWAPFHWDHDVGSVMVVREDCKKITPRQVEALCHYCRYKMQPLFEDSLGGGLVERTKEEVLSHLTKAKFAAYFKEYRACRLKKDPLWAGEKSPYEE